jgi:sulfur-oxidizing protein SoxY
MLLSAVFAAPAAARDLPEDRLGSVMWEHVAEQFFPDGEIIFDPRVKVMAPESAENQFQVPVTVDASGLSGVEQIVVVADLNPISHVLTYRPVSAKPFIGLRIKLEQASPIHVGVKLSDGTWRMGGAVVDAAGGGCTAPAQAHANPNWMATLGEIKATAAPGEGSASRLAFNIRHPMDTGLADGIPAFHIEEVEVTSASGEVVARLELFGSVSENPSIVLQPELPGEDRLLEVEARDTEGYSYGFSLDVPPPVGN